MVFFKIITYLIVIPFIHLQEFVITYLKYIIFGCLGFLSVTHLFAQQLVTIFYDSTWAINSREPVCLYRNTIIDTSYLAWIGPVQDHNADGTFIMKGLY